MSSTDGVPILEGGVKSKLPVCTRKQKTLIFVLAFANFSSTVVFSCIAPFFPNEAKSKGATETEIGLIFGIYELVIFLSSPIFGRYMAPLGPKFLFTSGLFVTGCTSILFGLLNQSPPGATFVGLCFAVRIVQALGNSAFITASFAIVADEFPGRIATMIGLLETFTGLGFSAGPFLGCLLLTCTPWGYPGPFLVLACFLFLAGFISIPLIPPQPSKEMKSEVSSMGFIPLVKMPGIILIMNSIVLCAIGFSFLDPTLQAHLDEFHLSTILIGDMFLLVGGTYTLSAPVLGCIMDESNSKYTREIMATGALTTAISFLLIGPAPFLGLHKSLWVIVLSEIVLGFGIAALFIPTFKDALDEAIQGGYPNSLATHGLISGMVQSCTAFGGFLGPTIMGGTVVEWLGFPWTSTILAVMNLFLAFVLALFQLKKCRMCKRNRVLDVEEECGSSQPNQDESICT